MDDARLNLLASELSACAPKERVQVKIQGDPDTFDFELLANREGFIRLAAECIEAAIAPVPTAGKALDCDWRYLFVKDSGVITRVARTESVQSETLPRTRREKFVGLVRAVFVWVALMFLVACMIVGFITLLGKV